MPILMLPHRPSAGSFDLEKWLDTADEASKKETFAGFSDGTRPPFSVWCCRSAGFLSTADSPPPKAAVETTLLI